MQKQRAQALRAYLKEQAQLLSNPDRPGNRTFKETFTVKTVEVLSGDAAAVTFEKNTGKLVLLFAYFNNGRWRSFCVSHGQVLAMLEMPDRLGRVETYNYKKNFDQSEHQQSPTESSG